MTRRILFSTLVVALAGLSAPQMVALAQQNDKDHHDSQANSNQSNSAEHQSASNDSSKSDNNSTSSAKSNRESQNDNRSSHNDNAANSNNDRDKQSNDRNADRDNSNRDTDSNNNSSHENARDNRNNSNRSVLTDRDRDNDKSNNDRQSYDRSRDKNSQADNRSESRSDRHRSYKKDFKFGRSNDHGLTLSSVTHSSVFYKSGLRDNDVIVSYDGHRIHNEDDFDHYVVYEHGRVPVVVYRDGHEQTIYVVFQDRDNVDRSNRDVAEFFGAEFDHRSNNGAVIIRIEEGSPADHAGLRKDDIVTAINGDRVSSGRDAERILGSLDTGQRVEVEYKQPGHDRQSRVKVTLGDVDRDRNVETTSYQTDDHPSVAVGVQPDGTRRDNDRDQRETNQDRRQDRRENRGGLLPRIRN